MMIPLSPNAQAIALVMEEVATRKGDTCTRHFLIARLADRMTQEDIGRGCQELADENFAAVNEANGDLILL